RAARERKLRHGLDAALVDRAAAVANAFAAFEKLPHVRMRFPALEFIERRQERIAVVQMNDEARIDEAVLEFVEEAAAAGFVVERPAHRVHHEAGAMLLFRELPKLLDADAELLVVAALAQLEALHQHLRKAAAYAFADKRIFAADLYARRVNVLVMPVLRDS